MSLSAGSRGRLHELRGEDEGNRVSGQLTDADAVRTLAQQIEEEECGLLGGCFIDLIERGLTNAKINNIVMQLSRNNMFTSQRHVQAFMSALQHNQSIRSLCLYQIGIGNDVASMIGEVLQHNQLLDELIHHNQIEGDGAARLGEALKHNQSLEILELHCTQVGNDGASSIGEALQYNQSLKKLII